MTANGPPVGPVTLPAVIVPSPQSTVADRSDAVAVGADGLIVEVHPCPEKAVSDGAQSLTLEMFATLMAQMRRIAEAMERHLATAPSPVGPAVQG